MSDALSTAWIQGWIDDEGTMQQIQQVPAPSTVQRQNQVKQIFNLAKKQGTTTDSVVTGILSASGDELSQYVMYSGETPVTDPVGLGLQAAFIRAANIGNIAKICNVCDDTALCILEQHEWDALQTGAYESVKKLSPSTQAALAVVMQAISQQMTALGSSGNMQDVMPDLSTLVNNYTVAQNQPSPNGSASGYRGRRRNNIDDPDTDIVDPISVSDFPTVDNPDVSGLSDTTDFEVPALIPVSTTLAPVTTTAPDTGVDIPVVASASNLPTVTQSSVNIAQNGPTAGGVINALSTIGNVIGAASKAIGTSVAGITSGTNAVSSAINNAGAGALQTWIQNNMVEVIGIILFIGVVIYVATRKK